MKQIPSLVCRFCGRNNVVRCRWSEEGMKTFSKKAKQQYGTVTNFHLEHRGNLSVLWDGKNYKQRYHPSFIDVIYDTDTSIHAD